VAKGTPALELEAVITAKQLNKALDDLRSGVEGTAREINNALGGTVRKTLVLETREDGNGAKKLVAVEKERLSITDKIIKAQQKAAKVEGGSATSLRQQVNQAKQARDELVRYQGAAGSLFGTIKRINPEWSAQNKRVSELSRQLAIAEASGFWEKAKIGLRAQGIVSFSNGLVQITQGLQAASIVVGQFTAGINNVVNTAAELQQFGLTFKAIGEGVSGGLSALQSARGIALGLGVNLSTVEESFRQLSPVVLNAGGTIQDVSEITEALSSRFAAFGISGDRARRVTNGVIQAFAKGKLQAEELTQQISEADPAFKTDLAGAIGVTTKELERMVKAGDITSEKLIEIIPQLSKSSLLFGKLGPSANSAVDALSEGSVTIDQVRANLQNLNQISLRNLAKAAEPVINAFFRIQAVVADFFSRISKSASVDTLANLFAKLAESAARILDVFLAVTEGVLAVINVLSPLINAVANIPGIFELAGLAILSKFIKPLNELDRNTANTVQKQQGFISRLGRLWPQAESPVKGAINAVKELNKQLQKPIQFNITKELETTANQIKKQTQNSANSVSSTVSTATSGIKNVVTSAQKGINDLNKQVLTAQSRNKNIELAPVLKTVVSSSVPRELNGASTAFLLAAKYLDQFSASTSGAIRITSDFAKRVGAASLLTARQLQGVTEGISFRPIDPKFLEDVKELSKTNPGAAMALLQASMRKLQEESRKTSDSFRGLDVATQNAFKAKTIESADQLKVIFKEIAASSGQLNSGQVKSLEQALSGQQQSIRNEIAQTRKETKGLVAELEKTPKDNQAKASIRSQGIIRQELSKTQKKLQDLYASEAKIQQERISSRRQAAGFDPSDFSSEASLYLDTLKKIKSEEKIASDSRIQELQSSTTKAKAELDSLANKQKKVSADLQAFRLPRMEAVTTEFDINKAEALREVIKSNNEELGSRLNLIRQDVAYSTDLNNILARGASQYSTTAQKVRALALASQYFGVVANVSTDRLRELGKEISNLQNRRKALLEQQAGRDVLDPEAAQRTASEIKNLDENILRLTSTQESLGKTAREAQIQQLQLADSADAFTRSASSGDKRAKLLSGSITGLGAGISKTFSGLKNFAKGILEELGPLQIALIAISVAQRAYSDATATSQIELDKNAESAKILTERNKELAEAVKLVGQEISGTDVAPPLRLQELSGAEVAWRGLGNAVADSWAQITGASKTGGAQTSQSIRQLISDIEEAKASGRGFKSPFQLIFEQGFGSADLKRNQELQSSLESARIQIIEFARAGTAAARGIASDSGVIDDQITTLREFAKISNVSAEGQSRFSSEFAKTSSSIGEQEKRLQTLTNQLEQFEALAATGVLGPEFENRLKSLRSEVSRTEIKLNQSREAMLRLGLDTGELGRQFANATSSVDGMNEALKGLQQGLNAAAVGSREFETFAGRVAALAGQIEYAQKLSKDPIFLQTALPAAYSNRLAEVTRLEEERARLLSDPQRSAKAEAANLEQLAKVRGELESIRKEQIENTIRLKVDKVAFEGELLKIKSEISQSAILLRTSIDQPRLREVLSQFETIRSRINQLNNEREQVAIKLQNPNIAPSERLGLQQEDVRISEQIRATIAAGAASLRDSAMTLRKAAQDAATRLQEAKQSLLNLKLSNLDFLPPEQRIAAINELNNKVQQIAESRGLKVVFQGTDEEILAAKQRFVDFYTQLEAGEKQIAELKKEINDINNAIQAIQESGVPETFGAIAGNAYETAVSMKDAAINLDAAGISANKFYDALDNGLDTVNKLSDAIAQLDGLTANVTITSSSAPAARWSGGPVSAGSTYTVNELGKEGFLSASGRISEISRPRNSTWRAPSSGTVIPANIWSQIDLPSSRVQASSSPAGLYAIKDPIQRLARLIRGSNQQSNTSSGITELAAVQANQALQIGKLGRAVDDLASKDWNVNVRVRNTGSAAYLEALNHRL
jgi:tape measure domain-containing protein